MIVPSPVMKFNRPFLSARNARFVVRLPLDEINLSAYIGQPGRIG